MALGNINQEGFVFSVTEPDLFSMYLQSHLWFDREQSSWALKVRVTPSWSIHQPCPWTRVLSQTGSPDHKICYVEHYEHDWANALFKYFAHGLVREILLVFSSNFAYWKAENRKRRG